MADDIVLSAGTADGARIRTDEDGNSDHWQYIKVAFGPDNTQTIVTASTGLPVNVLAQVPGTGATSLGKAIDTAVGATDTGVAILAKHAAASARLSTAENDYDVPRLSEFGALLTEPEQHFVIDDMNNLLGFGGTWAAINNDTTGVASSTTHVLGSASVEFDKVDGAVDSGIGGVTKALTSINLDGASPHDILQCVTFVSSIAALDGGSAFFFLRLGTNNTAYNEWRIPGTAFTAGVWETVAMEIGDASHTGQTGVGIDWAAITYIAVGFSFDAVGDTLANILVDEISFHTNQHVNAAINAEISSSVSTANINLAKVAGSPATKSSGNVGAGTQRVTIADDDTNLAAIKTAIEGTLTVGGTVTADAGTNLNTSALLTTAAHDAALGTAGTADAQVRSVQGIASMTPLLVDATGQGDIPITLDSEAVVLGAGTAAFGKLSANTGVDIGDVDVTSLPNAIGTGGSKVFHNADLNTDVEITDTAISTVYWIHCMNITAALAYLSIWDADSADIALGVDAATYQFIVPTQGDTNGAGFTINFGPHGIAHTTGLSIGAATTAGGSTDPNGVSVTVGYMD